MQHHPFTKYRAITTVMAAKALDERLEFYNAGIKYARAGEMFRKAGYEPEAADAFSRGMRDFGLEAKVHDAYAYSSPTPLMGLRTSIDDGQHTVQSTIACLRLASASADLAGNYCDHLELQKLAREMDEGSLIPGYLHVYLY